VSGQLHAPASLSLGKSPRYPFYRRLGGPQRRSGRYGEVKIFYPIGTRTPAPPGRPARSQSLYRLSYPGSKKILIGSKQNIDSCRICKIWDFHSGNYEECRLLGCWYLSRGFFYPDDGGDTFLRNVVTHDLDGAASQKTAFSQLQDRLL
jgi:hypothetical protein